MRGASRGGPEVEQLGREAPEIRRPNPAGAEAGRPASVSAAPAGVLRTHAPGRPRPAARRHDDRLPAVLRSDGLHAAELKERRELLRIGTLNTGSASSGSAVKGDRNRRTWSAGWRARRSQGAPPPMRRLQLRCATRRSIPSFFRRGKLHDGVPGAAKNTGGGALAFCYSSPRSFRDREPKAR